MATRFESVHLPHFEGPPDAVPPRIAKLFAFYGDLARFASFGEPGRARQTPIPCRQRPGRQPCPGLLVVRCSEVPPAVEWACPECASQGRISGWESTAADLHRIERDAGAPANAVAVSVPAHAALRDLARTEPSLLPLAYGAEVADAAQPILRVSAGDGIRHAAVLLRHALAASPRRAALLIELAEAVGSADEEELESDFIEIHPETAAELANALLALKDLCEPEFVPALPRRRPKSTKPRAAAPVTYRLKVTLRDVKPPVWRRLLVPSDIALPALHDVLQTAMGWYDCHLHAFRVRDRVLAPPSDDCEPLGEDSRHVRLSELAPRQGSRLVYEYDFGDGWCHDLVVEEIIDGRCSSVRCLGGRRRCPPEDCGGPWGYADLLEAIRDPEHERHEELQEWLPEDFDPAEFDVAETDAAVQSVRV